MTARQAIGTTLLVTGMLGAVPASAQPFAEAGTGANEEALGPQRLPGREVRPTPRASEPEAPAPAEPAPEPTPEPAADREWFGHRSWLAWDRATGDWGGLRTTAEDRGLSFAASYTGEWFGVLSGGVSSRGTVRGLFDLNATLDMDRAFGWTGGTIFADAYWIDGNSISERAGDLQGVSNIDAEDRVQLAELWFAQDLFDGSLRVKIGKIEANADFAFVDSAGDFINSSAGFTPAIVGMPSYPDPAFGVVVSWSPTDWFALTGGVFDGANAVDGVRTGTRGPSSFFSDRLSDDYFWIAEANLSWSGGRAGVAAWHHTGEFERFAGGTKSGTTGFYALAEHRIWSPEEGRGLDLFAQFGWADDAVSEVSWHLAGGVVWVGPCVARSDDALGLYVSHAALSSEAGFDHDETVFEVFYRWQLTPWASVKPDIQYILRPGGDPDIDDALVAGVRFEVSF